MRHNKRRRGQDAPGRGETSQRCTTAEDKQDPYVTFHHRKSQHLLRNLGEIETKIISPNSLTYPLSSEQEIDCDRDYSLRICLIGSLVQKQLPVEHAWI